MQFKKEDKITLQQHILLYYVHSLYSVAMNFQPVPPVVHHLTSDKI